MRQRAGVMEDVALAWCMSCLTWVDASLTLKCDHVWADHERLSKARAKRMERR